MHLTNRNFLITAICFFSLSGVSFGVPSESDKIQILDANFAVVMTVPVSNLTMLIPKEGLSLRIVPSGVVSESPRYFYFEDEKLGIILSGWFESADQYSSAKKVWAGDTKQWKRQGLPDPKNVSFEKIGGWDAVVYDMPVPVGNNTHIRAHWIEAGTWIDLHLSITSEHPISECRRRIMSLLRSVQVKAKK
ncbi:MAG TPA: hypothetical protein VGM64_07555 [Lacunisphaera sp.]